jgi:hypothetical protein
MADSWCVAIAPHKTHFVEPIALAVLEQRLGRSPVHKIKSYRAARKGDFRENSKKGMETFYACEIMAVPKETRVNYDNVKVIKSYGFP